MFLAGIISREWWYVAASLAVCLFGGPVRRLFLVDPNIIDFEPCRELRLGRITAVRSSDGEVQDQGVRLMEWVPALWILVECIFEVGRVQKEVVHVQPDLTLIPVHPPDVELLAPFR